jgi:cardiolipin synthase
MRPVTFTGHNEITLLHRGAEYFPALIAAFDAAKFEILLEVYIFATDPTADLVRDALERAAGRGVIVKVMADWVGTGRSQSNLLRAVFRNAGVNYRAFNPWFRRGLARNHRKLCVVDRKQAFMGGLNINDDLLSDDGFLNVLPAPRWDFALEIAGPLVAVIHRTMQAHWDNVAHETLKARWQHFKERRAMLNSGADAPMLAALVLRDNLRNRRTIQRSYLHALGHARKSVLLVSAYFAPGRKLRVALSSAAKRGVDVTILLDVGQYKLQDAVAHSFYPHLL